ncbi:hypothetical protein UT300012_30850 [Paraclostridium bifermentans]|jgi:alternate signal-mediated exported protein|uniref:hypothetical protein n=1 Tax=Paraclostridium bifermentans TaxID=1490 RepID=UPI000DF85828|nr:hypothetical protein [Paraclostridium bifermentans]MBS5953936.1 hypothetical protein [Paraclostridium bifermentans]MBU5289408.1 hypothetical protein [Paraclostridium bifermentans]MDU7904039.1 hypothetical protein [Peptostreptococcaceae bacterium]RDC49906.1 hypothetical protein DVA85_21425 [Acinetobacter sp. RIT592]
MKKNKTIAYALAATLLVGGTFLGTKALFTDKIDTVGELKISTGDVDIEVIGENKWKLHRQGDDKNTGTGNEDGNKLDFDNLKTGDYLTKTIQIENKGTLKANIDLQKNELVEIPYGFTGSATLSEINNVNNEDKILLPNEKAEVVLNIKLVEGGLHNEDFNLSMNTDNKEESSINLKDAWILNAQQVNGNEKVENQK